MRTNCDNTNWSGCCDSIQYRSNCPPSPTPPWSRPIQSSQTQTLTGDGAIDLTKDVTYLDSIVPKDSGDPTVPYAITIPDGNHKRQMKRIYVADKNIASGDSAVFLVSGKIAGFDTIKFDSIGFSAVLEWGGGQGSGAGNAGWYWIGGNATLE